MTKLNSSEIVFVLDRSGSMASIARDMEGGFNQFIKSQQAIPGECAVTLVQFDNVYEVVYAGKPLLDVPPLILIPRGSTSLLDAVGTAIQTTGERLRALPEEKRPSKVIVVVITDGQENSSVEFSHARVAEMIKHQRAKYHWDFVFLGADITAVSVANALNINNAAVYVANAAGAAASTASIGAAIGVTRSTGSSLNYNQATYDSHFSGGGTSNGGGTGS